jgi:hypothetical protein
LEPGAPSSENEVPHLYVFHPWEIAAQKPCMHEYRVVFDDVTTYTIPLKLVFSIQ